MTKKDYIVIAKIFANFETARLKGEIFNSLNFLIDEFAYQAEKDNPRFDEPRFREFIEKEVKKQLAE